MGRGIAIVFLFLVLGLNFSDAFQVLEERCHSGKLAPGWKDSSFCVPQNDSTRQCKVDLYYRLSVGREKCGSEERCCTFRERLPSIESDKCGLTYYKEGYRIIGGEPSEPGQWPWAVSIQTGSKVTFGRKTQIDWEHRCGGVLISQRLVLTAAHCFKDFDSSTPMRVVLGMHVMKKEKEIKRVYVNIAAYQMHEEFTESPKLNDIAIVILDKEVERTEYIQPICMPGLDHRNVGKKSRKCFIMGWGLTNKRFRTRAKELRHAEIQIFGGRRCERKYNKKKGRDKENKRFDARTQICAGVNGGKSVDACQGDSGGALACLDQYSNWQIAGIISWGEGCGRKGMPGIYTSVYSYRDWIQRKISDMTAYFVNGQTGKGQRQGPNIQRLIYNLTSSQQHSSLVFGP